MDSKNSKKDVGISEIFSALISLGNWSHKGLQNFRDSGFGLDLLELIRSSSYDYTRMSLYFINTIKFHRRTGEKGVSGSQIKELFNLVPINNSTVWIDFFNAVGSLGYSVGWWEENQPTWEDRDEWRRGLGMEPINPILKSPDGELEVIFKLDGYGEVWKKPPDGYRYANSNEITEEGIVNTNKVVVICENGIWAIVLRERRGFKTIIYPVKFFRDYVPYVAIVKL